MDALQQIPLTVNSVDATLVLDAGATTVSTTAAPVTAIAGKFTVSLGILTNGASPTTDATTGAAFVPVLLNQAAALVFGVNAAGDLKISQGTAVDTYVGVTTTVGAFKQAPPFPTLPDNFCPFAYSLVRVSPDGATFTTGTSNWNKSGVTCLTPVNIATLPSRPQIA